MRPIPRTLLCHSATLAQAASDPYGHETLTPIAQLIHIRVEPTDTLNRTNEGLQAQLAAQLWFDMRHSQPAGTVFSLGQRVVYQGKTYTVETVASSYDGRRLHHYEVGLAC